MRGIAKNPSPHAKLRRPLTWASVLVLPLCLLLPLSCDTPAPEPMEPEIPRLPDELPLKVEQRCPGDRDCADGSDDVLSVGYGQVDVSPLVEPFEDKNKNDLRDDDEPFTDRNGNGKFDAYWMAGYGNGRLAFSVHDPVWARAVVLRQNQTTVALVAMDALGLFAEETAEVEAILRAKLGEKYDIDLLLLHATHVHQNADTVGGWGPDFTKTGIHPDYQKQWRAGMADAVLKALSALRPARLSVSSIAVEDGAKHDMSRYVSDARDPVVIDNTLHTLRFIEKGDAVPPKPIVTVVNWAHHPESVGSSNHEITSDFVHFLRDEMEGKGVGPVLYVSGALGGQIGPGRVVPIDDMGNPVPKHSFKKAELIGRSVAGFALTAIADPAAKSLEGKDAKLRFRSAKYAAQIANTVYHFANMLGIYKRTTCCYDMSRPIDDSNLPSAETRVAYLSFGPLSIITNPGELLPELFLGGYDGSRAGTYTFIDLKKKNPPDVSRAPKPPYLVDIMEGERAHRMTFGLTMDFLGYIVPRYNWVLDENRPYFDEAEGDHYEETNSIGPLAEPQIVGTMRQLILSAQTQKSSR
ncbi:MAG TPA: neutral/alkaline non-lysosomal ceramidase N-terminal domain-containing protein [Pseudomonadota bacterium]|nr:neutral/alkaline non-lysosomal ceramidase N-terminal domain-containing protein [Pseudomonadota bacterium]